MKVIQLVATKSLEMSMARQSMKLKSKQLAMIYFDGVHDFEHCLLQVRFFFALISFITVLL